MSAQPRLLVDADACPVREEVFRVAHRLGLPVLVFSNGARGVRVPPSPLIRLRIVAEGADKADDAIAEEATPTDICITADIPLASRCLAKGAFALDFRGRRWTPDNIGSALAGRAVSQHLREMGAMTGGPSGMTAADRSRFLSALDTLAQAALRLAREGDGR